jgi:hypothetical protein
MLVHDGVQQIDRPLNAARPASISNSTRPVAKMSVRPSTVSPRTCSGAM